MADGGRPPTTFPCCTRQSRGWPAFAGHDTRGACHLGRTSMLPPVRIRQQHPPRRGLPGFGCAMSAVKHRAGPRPIRVFSVHPCCIRVESFLLGRVPHRRRPGEARCGVAAWPCALWRMGLGQSRRGSPPCGAQHVGTDHAGELPRPVRRANDERLRLRSVSSLHIWLTAPRGGR
jgi:hypothetical protein